MHWGTSCLKIVMICFSVYCFILKVSPSPFVFSVTCFLFFPPPFLLPLDFHLCLNVSPVLDCCHLCCPALSPFVCVQSLFRDGCFSSVACISAKWRSVSHFQVCFPCYYKSHSLKVPFWSLLFYFFCYKFGIKNFLFSTPGVFCIWVLPTQAVLADAKHIPEPIG